MRGFREAADERVGTGGGDLDVQEASDEVRGARQMDDAEVLRPSRDAPVPAHGVHEDLLAAPDPSPVPPLLGALLVRVEDLETAALLLLGHVVHEADRGGARTR